MTLHTARGCSVPAQARFGSKAAIAPGRLAGQRFGVGAPGGSLFKVARHAVRAPARSSPDGASYMSSRTEVSKPATCRKFRLEISGNHVQLFIDVQKWQCIARHHRGGQHTIPFFSGNERRQAWIFP